MQKDYLSFLEPAKEIVLEAGKISLSYFRQPLLIEFKENQTPVTVADKKIEEFIRKKLSEKFPGHGIMGEELGEESIDKEYVWSVDPIDGTISFVRGIPLFGTLLGLLHHKKPVLGIMYLPALDELYWASLGRGAFCNDRQVRVSTCQKIEEAVISLADIHTFKNKHGFLPLKKDRVTWFRTYTDCFGHGLVSRGSMDAMIDPIVAPWDVIPLACIIEEAGGSYFSMEGGHCELLKNPHSFVSCTPHIKDELIRLINKGG